MMIICHKKVSEGRKEVNICTVTVNALVSIHLKLISRKSKYSPFQCGCTHTPKVNCLFFLSRGLGKTILLTQSSAIAGSSLQSPQPLLTYALVV